MASSLGDLLLAAGRVELARRAAAAEKRYREQAQCNGRANCEAPHHLCICLSLRKKGDKR